MGKDFPETPGADDGKDEKELCSITATLFSLIAGVIPVHSDFSCTME